MKIFDCFMYFDEDIILDLRLNTLDKYVDYFVIVESHYNHKGEKKQLKFDLENFKKFKNKIIYLVYDEVSPKIEKIDAKDNEDEKSKKYILNAYHRENGQRNFINNGLGEAKQDDMILISDVDEIPNLEKIKFEIINKKIIFFKQDMFYYKFNLKLPNLIWTGTKACKKKYLLSPQWLRNIKDKTYPFYRIDTFFSKTKYTNIHFVNEGGWHFTNIKNAEEIRKKLKSYLHHREFDINPLSIEDINEIIKDKIAIYDLKVDKRTSKIGKGSQLEKISINKLPYYLQNNIEKYNEWID